MLAKDVYARDLPSQEQMIAALQAAGFGVETAPVVWDDMTSSWSTFVYERLAAWEAAEERTLRVHGRGFFEDRRHFFQSMDTLLTGGNLGGVRLVAKLRGGM